MTTLFLDLWQDLREKRLWPIAVGILAAMVAVPVVLFKPAQSPSVSAGAAPVQSAPTSPLSVISVDSGPVEGSKLENFSKKNPFKPLSDLKAASAAATTGGSGSTSSSTAAPVAAASAASAGSGTSGSNSSSTTASAGSPSSSGGSSTSGSSGAPSSSTPATTTTPTHWFRYAADFRFGTPGHLKTYKAPNSLIALPSDKTPEVLFMGATSDGASAIFMLTDSGFVASGKGKCSPTGDSCRIVTLTPSASSETFTSVDGQTIYKLQLQKIYTMTIPAPKAAATVKGAKAQSIAERQAAALVPALLSLATIGHGTAAGAGVTP